MCTLRQRKGAFRGARFAILSGKEIFARRMLPRFECAKRHYGLDRGIRQEVKEAVHGQLAQMDRALASGAKGRRFESCIAHHNDRKGLQCRTVTPSSLWDARETSGGAFVITENNHDGHHTHLHVLAGDDVAGGGGALVTLPAGVVRIRCASGPHPVQIQPISGP